MGPAAALLALDQPCLQEHTSGGGSRSAGSSRAARSGDRRRLLSGLHPHVRGRRFVNRGSVGNPEDGDARTAFAVLETSDDEVVASIHRVAYDAVTVAREMRSVGLLEELADKLVAAA